MTIGKEIFTENARRTLRNIGMSHLDLAHGAAVEAVRWCLAVRGRPTHHRLAFFEAESPALLAYLEAVASSGNSASWRTAEERIRLHAELLQDRFDQPCRRPWLAAIWHVLPEFAAIGETLLDRVMEQDGFSSDAAPRASPADDGSGEGDKGSGGKSGAAGTTAKPRPSSRLALPTVVVRLTEQEKKVLDLGEVETDDSALTATPDDSIEDDGVVGPTPRRGPK
jgi:hypothetical protein